MADINQTATVITRMNGEQPKQEIADLIKRIDKLKEARKAALDAGDTKTAEKLRKQIEHEEKALRKMQAAAVDVARVMKNLDKATPEELNRTLRALNKELKTMEHGSDAWNEHVKKIGEVKRAIANIQTELKAATLSFPEQVKNSFNTLTSLTGRIATAYRSVIASVEPYAQMEAAMADTRKFTGLTTDEVEELNEAFQRMDTRSSREQLNLLAQEAGRLGKNTKEDVLGYVEAADIINVALSDLGEGATQEIAKLSDIFHLEETQSTRDAMLSVGSAVNTLSQNCSASAPYLVEFSKRMAGVGATAKMDIQDILAFAAVLDSKGQQVEQSSSALGKLTMRLFQEPAKMAKMAGLNVEQFTQTLQRSTTEGLMMFLERIKELGANGGLSDLAPLFKDLSLNGVGLSNILTVLSDNLDMVRAQQQVARQAFEEGTSAVNEFQIANETAEARLQKHKKQLQETAIAFGKTMMPAVDGAVKGLNGLLTVVQASLRFLRDYGGIIISLAAGVAAYTVAVNAANIKTQIYNVRVKVAEAVTKRFNKTLAANPAGMVAAVLTTLIGVLAAIAVRARRSSEQVQRLNDRLNEQKQRLNDLKNGETAIQQAEKTASQQIAEKISRIDHLLGILNEENMAYNVKKKALNELNAIVPGYNAQLTEEGRLINANKMAMDKYIDSLYKAALAKATQSKREQLVSSIMTAEMENTQAWEQLPGLRKRNKELQELYMQSSGGNIGKEMMNQMAAALGVNDIVKENKDVVEQYNALVKSIRANNDIIKQAKKQLAELSEYEMKHDLTKYILSEDFTDPSGGGKGGGKEGGKGDNTDPLAEWRTRQLALNDIYYQQGVLQHEEHQRRKLEIERDYQKQRMDAAEQGSAEYLQAEAAYLKAESDLTRQSLQLTVSEENEAYQATQQTLRQKYMDGLMTAETYHRAMEEAELQHLYNLTQIYDEGSTERLRAQDQYQQAAIAAQERHAQEAEQQAEQAVRTIVDDINAFLESDGTKAFAKTMQQAVGAMSNIFSSLTSAIDAETQIQTAAIENRYKKEVERAGENTELVASLEKKKEAEIAKVKAEASEKKFKMDVFSTIAQGAMSAVSAWNAGWQAGFPAGPVLAPLFMALSLATTGVQIAALKKQQQAAAATGYAEGGYTRKGRKYEPAGIVHAGEWVASQELLQNPATAAVIAALDHAQRTNTIGSLGTAVVQRSSPASLGTPPSSPASIGTPASADPSLARTLRILTRRLDEPFVTVNTVEGNRGIKRAQDRYNRLTRNR